MKNITDFILESVSSYEEKIEKWWDKTKTPPQYLITKTNHPISGREELVGTLYIHKLKLLGYGSKTGETYDKIISVGGHGWEGMFNLGKKENFDTFKEPSWTPVTFYYDENDDKTKLVTSWDEIHEIVNDRDWVGELAIYKGPQPKE